ncbi:MAG: transcriptional repressor LexA [Pseudomonadota bacterium]
MESRGLGELGLMEIDLNQVEVPLLGTVAAGQPIEAVPEELTVSIPASMLGRYRTFALKVRGESMIDAHVKPGDVIVVEERQSAANGEMVVAMINESEVTLKKFYLERDHIRLEPANQEMEPIILRHEQVRVLGVVSGLIRHYH